MNNRGANPYNHKKLRPPKNLPYMVFFTPLPEIKIVASTASPTFVILKDLREV